MKNHERHEKHEKNTNRHRSLSVPLSCLSCLSWFVFRNGSRDVMVWSRIAILITSVLGSSAMAQDDLAVVEERAMQAAVARVAPSVVRIETVGGIERLGGVLFGAGPTTGVIVSADGYIISSAFNF